MAKANENQLLLCAVLLMGSSNGASAPLRRGPLSTHTDMKKNTGARWEITIDGVPRSYRDVKALAIEGAEYLKERNPHAEITVRDLERIEPTIVIKAQPVQVKR